MSVNNVFGVNLRHPLYDVDEVLLEEDMCNLTTSHPGFLLREQLAAFVSGSQVISTPGTSTTAHSATRIIGGNNNNNNNNISALITENQNPRDLEERAVIQVPLWVARSLVPRQHAKMNTPEGFSLRSLLDFRAGPFLPLVAETKGPRFFDFGVAVSAFLPPGEAKRVREAAVDIFRKRYTDVVLEGYKKGSTGTRDAHLRAKLTTREQNLYNGVAQDIQWRTEWRRWLQ